MDFTQHKCWWVNGPNPHARQDEQYPEWGTFKQYPWRKKLKTEMDKKKTVWHSVNDTIYEIYQTN